MRLFNNLIHVETDNNKRIFGLDVLRALAIFLVMFAHSTALFPDAEHVSRKILFYVPAYIGVDLFFVLSGFLVGSIIIRNVESAKNFSIFEVRRFWIRRWFRTLPNYYLVLLSQLLLLYALSASIPLSYLNFFSFTQNFAGKHPPFFYEAWTLSIEEWFYFLFPLIILGCKSLLPRSMSSKSILLGVITSFLLSSLAGRIIASSFYQYTMTKGMQNMVIFRLDSIMFGVLFAYGNYYYEALLARHKMKMISVGLLMVSFCIGYLIYSIAHNTEDFFLRTFYFSVCSLGMACILPLFILIKKEKLSTLANFVTHLSIISYSAYLIHNCIVIKVLYTETPIMGNYIVNYFLFWMFTIAGSTALYKLFERPMMSLREKFRQTITATPKA